MTEIQEIAQNKTREELEGEISFQLQQGENPGGTIISQLQDTLKTL